jgi:hypothetical protein
VISKQYEKLKMSYSLTFSNGSAYVRNERFPGRAGQDFETGNVVLNRRSTTILAPSIDDMSTVIATLSHYLNKFCQKVEESRCTEFKIGNGVFRVANNEKKNARESIESLSKFWSMSEPLLQLATDIWENLPGIFAESQKTEFSLVIASNGHA